MAGDILFYVTFEPHSIFRRIGADLFVKKEITLLEALNGVNFELTLLDKHKIKIVTHPFEIISPKDKKTIKGRGMPFYKDSMNHGNLYIEFDVKFPLPGELTAEHRQILQKILPGKSTAPTLEQLQSCEMMEDFEPTGANTNEEGGKKVDEEEEEQEGFGGGPRVQCGQQ